MQCLGKHAREAPIKRVHADFSSPAPFGYEIEARRIQDVRVDDECIIVDAVQVGIEVKPRSG